MAAPYLFRLVAFAGIVKGHFWPSCPDNPMGVFRAIRLLLRLAICARGVARMVAISRSDLRGGITTFPYRPGESRAAGQCPQCT
jgi:hypothetical protein